MSGARCQLLSLPGMAHPVGLPEALWQFRKRLKRVLKRRWNYLINLFNAKIESKSGTMDQVMNKPKTFTLQPGDRVRIRSIEEIQGTLNRWNQIKGCSFMEEMRPYCGTTQGVLKRVEKFLDERDYLLKKCKGIVILDGVFCEGTKDFGPCDRSCFYFWREEWLEKI